MEKWMKYLIQVYAYLLRIKLHICIYGLVTKHMNGKKENESFSFYLWIKCALSAYTWETFGLQFIKYITWRCFLSSVLVCFFMRILLLYFFEAELHIHFVPSTVFRLNKLHVSQGKQNKTIMLTRGDRKMRSVRHSKVSWWVILSLILWCWDFGVFLSVYYSIPSLKNMVFVFIGRRSPGPKGQGRGSCCIGVWKVERWIFCWCWRYHRKWSARGKSRSAF